MSAVRHTNGHGATNSCGFHEPHLIHDAAVHGMGASGRPVPRHTVHLMHRNRPRFGKIISRSGSKHRQWHARATLRLALEQPPCGMTDGAVPAHHGQRTGTRRAGRRRNACFITALPRCVQLHRESERAERPLDPRRHLFGPAPPRRRVDQHNNGCAPG